MRREMIELKKDFDDMQAAVLQLKYELKLRNETVRLRHIVNNANVLTKFHLETRWSLKCTDQKLKI